MGRVRRACAGRFCRHHCDQPRLRECARRWWPLVAGSLGLAGVLLGAYLMVPRQTGASAAEWHRDAVRDAREAGTGAAVTSEMRALGVTHRISAFTTRFTPGEPRVRNIGIAARALDGMVTEAGEVFSFNRALGPRTRGRGYVPAPSIIHSRLVQDVGGGICQVSSTLFNAVFDAGLDIREARAHSLWMPEYPQGREAAVAYPELDFRWRNDTGRPVMIKAALAGDSITVALWGTRRYDVRSQSSRRYALTSYPTTVEHGDSCVPTRGGRGFEIDVWRILERDGREVRRERFHTAYEPKTKVTCA